MEKNIEILIKHAKSDLKDLLEGKTLSYRKETGNLQALIPGVSFATMILIEPKLAPTFREIGKTLGSQVVAEFIKSPDLKSILGELAGVVEATKMGRAKVIELKEKEAILHIYECYDCAGLPNVGRPLCAFDEGLIEGILEASLKQRISVKEDKCWGNGYEFCEFIIKILA